MCGRWYVDLMADEELAEYYVKIKNKKGIKVNGEVFPSDQIMVIANNKKKEPIPASMKWGYQVGKNLVFNSRRESIHEKEIFKDGIENRRCVIPANLYYEWQKDTKEKYEIKEENTGVFYFLGIYRFENDEPVCSIITKEASESMSDLHPRMPVIVNKDKINEWLLNNSSVDMIMDNSINELIVSKI